MFIVRYKPHKSSLIIFFIIIPIGIYLWLIPVLAGPVLFFRGLWGVVTELNALRQEPDQRRIVFELNHVELWKKTFYGYRTVKWEEVVKVKRDSVSNDGDTTDGWLFVRKFPHFNIFVSDNIHGLARMAFAKKLKTYYKGPLFL